MKPILLALSLLICFSSATLAQNTTDPNTQRLLEQAARNGRTVPSEITVNSSVHVQAVLIPRPDAKRIFGKEISENYAVIQLIVGNKSPDAALIIHGVFIDYRDWPLSGATPTALMVETPPNKYQAPSVPSQVASEEYRVVRGQLLDAQTDTLRNRFLRYLTLAGNLAGAFTFSLNEDGIVKGIAAVTGVGIPGLATAWPDKTVEQLNRVSDLGFRTNKVVSRESSEIVVCFFPIDRFLTPGFRRLFLKSPALFFAPLAMLADRKVEGEARAAVKDFLPDGLTFEKLQRGLACYMKVRYPDKDRIGFDECLADLGLEKHGDQIRAIVKRDDNDKVIKGPDGKPQVDPDFATFMALEFIGNVSLNRVTVTVDGVMAVDVKTIAGRIDEVAIDNVADCGSADGECLWGSGGAHGGIRKGVIRGAYLKDAQLNIAEAERLSITDLKKIDEESTDSELRFSFKLNAPVPNQTKLHFTVTKPAAVTGARPIESNTWEYVVAYSPSPTAVSSVTVDNTVTPAKLTVKGKGFSGTPFTVTLIPQFGNSVTVTPTAGNTFTDTSFEALLPTGANKLHPGCWKVQVTGPKGSSNKTEQFAVPPDPALDSAERSDKFIFLKGKDLIDFGACGSQPISFKLVKSDGTGATDLEVKDWNNGAPLLNLPDKAKEGAWKVQVIMAGKTPSEKPLTVRP